MTYKRRYLNKPSLKANYVYCGSCSTKLLDDVQCPDCGFLFDDIEITAYSEPDWECEKEIPDLWLNSYTPLPRDTQIRIEEKPEYAYRFHLFVNGYIQEICRTREEAESRMLHLQQAIQEHYELQDRKRKENAI